MSDGELYTVLTSKKTKGRKGSVVAIIKGTKSEVVIDYLFKISRKLRLKVQEITLDMAGSMKLIAKRCFPNAILVIDRFHVQKLAIEALQEIRIKHRWEAMDKENEWIAESKFKNNPMPLELFENGDTRKQLLARSRYLLYKSREKWSESQYQRAKILFEHYPDIEKAYNITDQLRQLYKKICKSSIYTLSGTKSGTNVPDFFIFGYDKFLSNTIYIIIKYLTHSNTFFYQINIITLRKI